MLFLIGFFLGLVVGHLAHDDIKHWLEKAKKWLQ